MTNVDSRNLMVVIIFYQISKIGVAGKLRVLWGHWKFFLFLGGPLVKTSKGPQGLNFLFDPHGIFIFVHFRLF